jgi:cyclopropane fatty-acyl-phospholipid synthase-like methyltransferase
MIDKEKVKAFWDSRAEGYGSLDFNSIGNLEQNPENLALKVRLETEKVFHYLGSVEGKTILDLGAGVGQWAFRFIEQGARSVTAVEYSADLAAILRREVEKRGVTNLELIISGAEEFLTNQKFDIVYTSGLFVCMDDEQADKLASHLPSFCHPDSVFLMRDGTGVKGRHEINNRHSDHLNANYSATYRTAEGYEALFAQYGLALIRHENMFPEDCPLNKYPETRLRIYEFKLAKA